MVSDVTLHKQTIREIDGLELDATRPLVIVDADEVLVMFMAAFEDYIDSHGLFFDWAAFRLHGSIRRLADRELASAEQVIDILLAFFRDRTEHLEAVPGAADALARLAEKTEVVVLSNVPMDYGDERRRGLSRQGMAYPVVVNAGPKGPAVRRLTDRAGSPVFFIDDSPQHHKSVAEHADHVHRIHYVHDKRLAKLSGPAPHSHRQSLDWTEIQTWIESELAQG